MEWSRPSKSAAAPDHHRKHWKVDPVHPTNRARALLHQLQLSLFRATVAHNYPHRQSTLTLTVWSEEEGIQSKFYNPMLSLPRSTLASDFSLRTAADASRDRGVGSCWRHPALPPAASSASDATSTTLHGEARTGLPYLQASRQGDNLTFVTERETSARRLARNFRGTVCCRGCCHRDSGGRRENSRV